MKRETGHDPRKVEMPKQPPGVIDGYIAKKSESAGKTYKGNCFPNQVHLNYNPTKV